MADILQDGKAEGMSGYNQGVVAWNILFHIEHILDLPGKTQTTTLFALGTIHQLNKIKNF